MLDSEIRAPNHNVAAAIELTRPFAVDVATGVEAEPGRKDHGKLAAFFDAAQGAQQVA